MCSVSRSLFVPSSPGFISQNTSCGNIKVAAASNCKIISVKPRWRALLIPRSRSRWHLKLSLPEGAYSTCSPMLLLSSPPRTSRFFHCLSLFFLPSFLCVPLIQILPQRFTLGEKALRLLSLPLKLPAGGNIFPHCAHPAIVILKKISLNSHKPILAGLFKGRQCLSCIWRCTCTLLH